MQTCRVALALFAAIICLGDARTAGQQSASGNPPPRPARDPTDHSRAHRPNTGTATISGTVVALSSGRPLGHATVSIYAPGFPDGRMSTTTDYLGRFEFAELAAGRYTVGASKAGFVNVLHGQRRVGGAGHALTLPDGAHLDIQLKLPRGSVITGMVRDERGDPAVNASVRVFRFSMAFGYRRPEAVANATTDDRGIYRIHSLQPGDYAVCTSTRNTRPLNDGQRIRTNIDQLRKMAAFSLDPQRPLIQQEFAKQLAALEARLPAHVDPVIGYAPVCHPGTASLPSRIRVAPDEERTGMDFHLTPVPLARIEGFVAGMPQVPSQMDPIMLVNADQTLSDMSDSARPDSGGRFTFSNVAPGRYTLVLRGTPDGSSPDVRLSAEAEVVVAGEDISNVVLNLQRGATVQGQVVFNGTPPPGLAIFPQMQVRIEPAVPRANGWGLIGGTAATPDASGRFVLPNIPPGEYRMSAFMREPAGWFVESATIAGQDVAEQPFALKANQTVTTAIVTLTDQRAELTGTIMTDKGEPAFEYLILVYSTDERYWTSRSQRMFVTNARQNGKFVIRGLRAGNYRVATLLDPEFGAWFNPEFVRSLESTSILISISDREKKVLNLRVPDGG